MKSVARLFSVIAVVALVTIACRSQAPAPSGTSKSPQAAESAATKSTTPTPQPAANTPGPVSTVAPKAASTPKEETMEPPASAAGATPSAAVPSNPVVVLKTNMGTIEVQLDPDHAPLSTQNFLSYVRKGQYNGTVFHRVIPNFMIQGGGLTRDLVEKRAGAGIKNESNNGLKNARGTIAMARTPDPDSATCQFFINVVDNPGLDYQPGRPGYAVFGKVVSGMDVVDKIRNVPTHTAAGGLQNVPVQTVLIESASVK